MLAGRSVNLPGSSAVQRVIVTVMAPATTATPPRACTLMLRCGAVATLRLRVCTLTLQRGACTLTLRPRASTDTLRLRASTLMHRRHPSTLTHRPHRCTPTHRDIRLLRSRLGMDELVTVHAHVARDWHGPQHHPWTMVRARGGTLTVTPLCGLEGNDIVVRRRRDNAGACALASLAFGANVCPSEHGASPAQTSQPASDDAPTAPSRWRGTPPRRVQPGGPHGSLKSAPSWPCSRLRAAPASQLPSQLAPPLLLRAWSCKQDHTASEPALHWPRLSPGEARFALGECSLGTRRGVANSDTLGLRPCLRHVDPLSSREEDHGTVERSGPSCP